MEQDYRIERIGPAHYHHLVTLMHRCFGVRTDVGRIAAKFDTAAFGASNIGYLAFAQNGSAAAYYGVFPVPVRYAGKIRVAAQSGDTMTDPDHQKRGLFVRLAELTYKLAAEQGIVFVFGFPNDNSLPGFEKRLHWTFAGRLQEFRMRAAWLPFCELASRYGRVQQLYDKFSGRVLGRYLDPTATWAHGTVDDMADGLVHDGDLMEYKKRLGASVVLFEGFRMIVRARTHLYIGDVAPIPGTRVDELLGSIKRLGRKLSCRTVVFTFSPGHWLEQHLRSRVAAEESLPIGYLMLEPGAAPPPLTISRVDLDTF